jgi:uncharacterized protein YbaR (Trm112 family)
MREDGHMSTIESWLREILRCPACRSTLRDVTGAGGEPELACTGCSLAYRIDDGIPVLLVDEARDRDADGGSSGPAGPGPAGTDPATDTTGSTTGHGAAPDQGGL